MSTNHPEVKPDQKTKVPTIANVLAADDASFAAKLQQLVSGLTQAKALQVLKSLDRTDSRTYACTGGMLSYLKKNASFGKHKDWPAFVEAETKYSRSGADHLVLSYDRTIAAGIEWSRVERIGTTKLRAIAKYFEKHPADIDWLFEQAEANSADALASVLAAKYADATQVAKPTTAEKLKQAEEAAAKALDRAEAAEAELASLKETKAKASTQKQENAPEQPTDKVQALRELMGSVDRELVLDMVTELFHVQFEPETV